MSLLSENPKIQKYVFTFRKSKIQKYALYVFKFILLSYYLQNSKRVVWVCVQDSMHYSSGEEENSLVEGEKGESSV